MSCHLSCISYELFTKCATPNVTHVHSTISSWQVVTALENVSCKFQNFHHHMAHITSSAPHRHASPRTLSRVLPSLARQIACYQWLKCHWTRGNAVPAPPVTEIQRSHTSNFIERVPNHLLGAHFGPRLIYSSLTSDSTLTTACYGVNCLSCQCEACLSR